MPGGPRGLQNRCRFVSRAEVGSIPTLSAIFWIRFFASVRKPGEHDKGQDCDDCRRCLPSALFVALFDGTELAHSDLVLIAANGLFRADQGLNAQHPAFAESQLHGQAFAQASRTAVQAGNNGSKLAGSRVQCKGRKRSECRFS